MLGCLLARRLLKAWARRSLFKSETTRPNHVSVGKDAHLISACNKRLRHVPKECHRCFFAIIFNAAFHRILQRSVFITKRTRAVEQAARGRHDAYIDVFNATCCRYVARDVKAYLQCRGLIYLVGRLSTLVFGYERDARCIELCGDGHLLGQRTLLRTQSFYLSGGGLVLSFLSPSRNCELPP